MVFERIVDDRALTFGTSGKLADDALVMYDRQTETEWKQPTGTAFAGPLAPRRLRHRAAPMMSWERFREGHPDGLVQQGPRARDGSDAQRAAEYALAPYRRYVQGEEFGLRGMRGEGRPRSWSRTNMDAKTVVVGVEIDDRKRGYPLPEIARAGGFLDDRLADREIIVVIGDGHGQVFENPGFRFESTDSGVKADGTTWDPVTGESADGRTLERVPSRRMFAFAWQDAHGPNAFFGDGD